VKLLVLFLIYSFSLVADENYKLEKVAGPTGELLDVKAFCQDHSSGFMLVTKKGEVWNLRQGKWSLFARGLQQPSAICKSWREGEYFCLQREELTKLVDEDNDGKADLYESFGKGWQGDAQPMPLIGDTEGNFYGALPLSKDESNQLYRGAFYKVDYLGEFSVLGTGVARPRSAFMNEQGDLFFSVVKSSYISADAIYHVQEGDFLGNPMSLRWDSNQKRNLQRFLRFSGEERLTEMDNVRKRPCLYFPSEGQSEISGVTMVPSKQFGLQPGQLLIADSEKPKLWCASLEKVGGAYQGAVFTFSEIPGLEASSILLVNDELYMASTKEVQKGGSNFSKLKWSGQSRFSIVDIKATSQGFRLIFNEALAEEDLPGLLSISSFSYKYDKNDNHGRHGTREHQIKSAHFSVDRKSVTLVIDGLEAGRIVGFDLKKMTNEDGHKLKYSEAYYTLNKIPE